MKCRVPQNDRARRLLVRTALTRNAVPQRPHPWALIGKCNTNSDLRKQIAQSVGPHGSQLLSHEEDLLTHSLSDTLNVIFFFNFMQKVRHEGKQEDNSVFNLIK